MWVLLERKLKRGSIDPPPPPRKQKDPKPLYGREGYDLDTRLWAKQVAVMLIYPFALIHSSIQFMDIFSLYLCSF